MGAPDHLSHLVPRIHITAWYDYSRIVMCVCVTVYSVVTARSWQRKLDQWRGLIQVTGARL